MKVSEHCSKPEVITVLGAEDVVMGRGAGPDDHTGNGTFRRHIEQAKDEYFSTISRKRKHQIALRIVQRVRESCGRFVRKLQPDELGEPADSRLKTAYVQVDDEAAIRKAKQAFRYVQKMKKNGRPPVTIESPMSPPRSSAGAKRTGTSKSLRKLHTRASKESAFTAPAVREGATYKSPEEIKSGLRVPAPLGSAAPTPLSGIDLLSYVASIIQPMETTHRRFGTSPFLGNRVYPSTLSALARISVTRAALPPLLPEEVLSSMGSAYAPLMMPQAEVSAALLRRELILANLSLQGYLREL